MKLVTRAEWGAKPPRSVTRLESVNRVFVHYTAMDSDEVDDHALCAERVRGIQRYHTSPSSSDPTKPWADIAYSFLVCNHGYVFEGRGWGVRTAATGACNYDSLAICFLGDDSSNRDDATEKALRAIKDLFAKMERRYGNLAVYGHRNCKATACPGDELMTWITKGMPVAEKRPKVRFVLRTPNGRRLAKSAPVPVRRGENRRLRQFFTALAANERRRQKRRRAKILNQLKKGRELRLTREKV